MVCPNRRLNALGFSITALAPRQALPKHQHRLGLKHIPVEEDLEVDNKLQVQAQVREPAVPLWPRTRTELHSAVGKALPAG